MLNMAEVWEVVTKSSDWSNCTKELWDSVYQMGIKYQVTRNTQTPGSRGQTSVASFFGGISLLWVWAEHTLTAVWHMPQACVMTAACRVSPCLPSAAPPHLVTHASHPTWTVCSPPSRVTHEDVHSSNVNTICTFDSVFSNYHLFSTIMYSIILDILYFAVFFYLSTFVNILRVRNIYIYIERERERE